MPKDTAIAARIDFDLDQQLRRLAAATRRSRSWHIAEALRGYLTAEREFLAAVAEGQRALAEGKVVGHGQVKRRFQRRARRR
ncbi:MAG: CopG family ribbon-helix-helix protein [Dongiaceae bacterium]